MKTGPRYPYGRKPRPLSGRKLQMMLILRDLRISGERLSIQAVADTWKTTHTNVSSVLRKMVDDGLITHTAHGVYEIVYSSPDHAL